MECLSSNATFDVFPELTVSAENNDDLDFKTTGVAAVTNATYSMSGMADCCDSGNLVAVYPVLWTTTPSSTTLAEDAPTLSHRPFFVFSLDNMLPARCSERFFDNNIAKVLTQGNKERGKMLRPSPWPSFVTKHPSTTRSGIIEPPLSATTALSRDVIPRSTLLLLYSIFEASWTSSPGSGHSGPIAHLEASCYLDSVGSSD
jgi:hypothetical protein